MKVMRIPCYEMVLTSYRFNDCLSLNTATHLLRLNDLSARSPLL